MQIYNAQCHRDQGRFIVLLSTHELEFFSVHPNLLRPLPASRRSSFVICDNSCTISVVSCQVNARLPSLHRRLRSKQVSTAAFLFSIKKNIISSNSGPYKSSRNHSKLTDPYQAPASSRLRTLSPILSAKISSKFSTFPVVNNVPRLFIAVPHLKFFP